MECARWHCGGCLDSRVDYPWLWRVLEDLAHLACLQASPRDFTEPELEGGCPDHVCINAAAGNLDLCHLLLPCDLCALLLGIFERVALCLSVPELPWRRRCLDVSQHARVCDTTLPRHQRDTSIVSARQALELRIWFWQGGGMGRRELDLPAVLRAVVLPAEQPRSNGALEACDVGHTDLYRAVQPGGAGQGPWPLAEPELALRSRLHERRGIPVVLQGCPDPGVPCEHVT
mmetsp:Transcript_88810/g.287097  ORF Transcript_88810/g.287097 Transcript_88810/m.287097 type:complete len:231 (+) Transcript_88810:3479-4171(+)